MLHIAPVCGNERRRRKPVHKLDDNSLGRRSPLDREQVESIPLRFDLAEIVDCGSVGFSDAPSVCHARAVPKWLCFLCPIVMT